MKNFILLQLFTAAIFASQVFSAQQQTPNLYKSGQTVCFIGDSIAHGGFYSQNIQLFYATRYPNSPAKFRNSGMSGQGVGGVLNRLDWDVFDRYNPDVNIIMIGMNDAPRGMYSDANRGTPKAEKSIESFHKNYPVNMEKTVKKLSERTKKVIVFTPSIFDQTAKIKKENLLGCNDALGWCGEIDKQLAKKYGAQLVDIWGYMTDMNAKYQLADPTRSFIDADRVHPRDLGGFVMMAKFVSDLNEAKFVSKIQIDAARAKFETFNANLSNLNASPALVEFTAHEKALPFPMSKAKDDADKVVNFADNFNVELLKISNLQRGDYELSIDGEKVGRYNARQLEDGVNLALNKNTPQYKQAERVEKLSMKWREKAAKHRDLIGVEIWLKIGQYKTTQERCQKLQEMLDTKKITYIGDINWAKAYLKNKPNEAQMIKDYEHANDEVFKAAQTVPHNFSLKKIN